MIGYLRGEILENADGKLILSTAPSSDTGAVGYAVTVPLSPAYVDWSVGKRVEVFVHTHVREDALDLYGFASRAEKELFLTLLTVNGIGPKGAIGILSKVNPDDLVEAVLTEDKESLTRIPGIGKKTAERVVLELAEPLRKKIETGHFARPGAAASRPGGASGSPKPRPTGAQAMLRDAKEALVGLGYREQEVGPLLNRVIAEAETPPAKVEDLIRSALRQLI